MSPEPDILVVATERVAQELSRLAGQRRFAHRSDPYEALQELARRRYDALVLTEGCPDPSALARAARRLAQSTRRYLLCSPAGEADLRAEGSDALDDYFIYPPSSEELEQIFQARPAAAAVAAAFEPPAVGEAVELSAFDIAALVESACTTEGLMGQIRELVGRWIGAETRWADAEEPTEQGEPLLLLDGDRAQVLLSDAQEVAPEVRAELKSLQVLLGPLAAQVRRTEALHRLAVTDHLTGAYNRRYFYHLTDQLLARAKLERFRVTLLLYDIDDFKRYNDTYGHAAGDDILREIVALMQAVTRERDVVARIGGDEFAVLFWDAEPPRRPDSRHPDNVQDVAKRFLGALARHEFPSLGPEAKGVLTISGGLATYPWDGRSCRELLRHADAALRQAKQSGKNAIYLVGEGSPG